MAESTFKRAKSCGQKANSTAVMTPASVTFTTNAIVAISDTLRWAFFFPTTRVMSTVEAVPMAERAMVMMLSICSAFPTAAAGSVPKGDSMTWFTLPTMICMNSSMNKGIESLNTSPVDVLSAGDPHRARFCAARAARSVVTAAQPAFTAAPARATVGAPPLLCRSRRGCQSREDGRGGRYISC